MFAAAHATLPAIWLAAVIYSDPTRNPPPTRIALIKSRGSQTKSHVGWSWKMPKRWLRPGHRLQAFVGTGLNLGLVLLPLASLSCSSGVEPGVVVPTVTAGPARLSRLTKGQYLQTLTSLLGPGLAQPTK